MPTPYNNWPEVPAAVQPDVPFHVNAGFRAMDATVHELETLTVPRIAKLESEAGFPGGSTLQLEDEITSGLVADKSSRTAKELAKNYVDKGSVGSTAFPVWSGIQRMYISSNTPANGNQPGDLVLKISDPPKGPGGIPGCIAWYDVSTSAVGTPSRLLTDLSGYGRDTSPSPEWNPS